MLIAMKRAFEKGVLLLHTPVLVKAVAPTRLGILYKAKTIGSQIGIPKLRKRRNVGERCCDGANGVAVILNEFEKLEEPPMNNSVRNMVEAGRRLAPHYF